MLAVGIVALAFVGTAGACRNGDDGNGTDDPGDRTTSPTSGATTTTLTSEQEEVKAAYLAFWEMAIRLAQDPDPNDPEIAKRASGEAFGNLVDGLTTLKAMNQHTEIGPRTSHDVLSIDVDRDTAIVEDCAVDDSRLLDSDSLREVDSGLATTHWEAVLVLTASNWLVDRFEEVDAWDDAVSCV